MATSIGRRKIVAVTLGDGETAHVRVMTGRELAEFRESISRMEAEIEPGTRRDVAGIESLVALTVCDKKGERLVPVGQEAEVQDWPYTTLIELFNASSNLNGIAQKKD